MSIEYASAFWKSFFRLSPLVQERFRQREEWFRANPHDIRLRTHALKGNLKGLWAFSVTPSIRVVFKFEDKRSVTLLRVGTHDVSYR